MEIEGHFAVISFVPALGSFQGRFIGLSGHCDFLGDSIQRLISEGKASLREYLKDCKDAHVDPYERQGDIKTFTFRYPEWMSEAISTKAIMEGVSLNSYLINLVEKDLAMTGFSSLIDVLENSNPKCEILGNFRAITAINFPPDRYQHELGNAGEICVFSETKKALAFGEKNGKVYWEYFIPHTATSSEFYSTVERNLSIWDFTRKILNLGVEIYGLDEVGNLFGISHKHGVRVISECARKSKHYYK
ncbi:type II toxin-antitoxin system HicB family antitoxin [Klebsiella oxytoca]|nr:type II toxin-antitoxin system HicB family antitoxin [Klebsiella oxytoca]